MTAFRAKQFPAKQLPAVLADGKNVGGNIRSIIATYNLSTAGGPLLSGDTLFIGRRPRGSRYLGHRVTSGVSLGTSTMAIGVAGTAGKYRDAAVFTAVDAPTAVGKAAQLAADPLTADEDMIATFGTANLPTSNHELVIETFYSTDNG